MRCTCRRCGVTGPRQASLRPMAAGGTRFKSSSRGLPPRSPDSTPVCAISLSSSIFIGSPRSPSGIPVVAAPVSRHRNFRRSATGGTGPDQSSGWIHARHRPDEGVRQSRPGHPGVGRFGSWFPRRSPDPEDRAADAAFPRRPDGDTVGGPSAAPHRISRILSGTDVESIPPFLGFWVLRLFSPTWDGTGDVFLLLISDDTGSLDTGTRRSWLSFTTFLRTGREPPVLGGPCRGRIDIGPGRIRQSPRGLLLAAFRSLACVVTTAPRRAFGPRVIRTRIRPLAGAECAPNSNRGRTAGTVHTWSLPALRPHPSVPCASCGCGKSFS